MRFYHLTLLSMLLVLIMAIGCDEGLNMADSVIGGGEPPVIEVDGSGVADPAITMGEMKQQDSEGSGAEVADAADVADIPEVTEPVTPDPDPVVPQEPLEVVEVAYYADADLTMPISEAPYFGALLYDVGTEIYTKMVFSRAPEVVVGGPGVGLPEISYRFLGIRGQYSVVDTTERLQHGDAKLYEEGDLANTFVCKIVMLETNLAGGFFATFHDGTLALVGGYLEITKTGRAFDITDPPLIGTLLSGSDAAYPAPESSPGDFVGQVCVPFSTTGDTSEVYPVQGVTVTIIEGPRSGEQSVTDPGGYYHFRDIPTHVMIDGVNYSVHGLHLRVEREHFETQEVTVSRREPTKIYKPKNGIHGRYAPWDNGFPSNRPGTILIGQEWPEEIRFIFEEMVLPDDLMFFADDRSVFPGLLGGFYVNSIVTISDKGEATDLTNGIVLHEIAHAHQHALAVLEGVGTREHDWGATSEGRAYREARDRDWREYGKTSLDESFELQYPEWAVFYETAAEIAAVYWGIDYLGGISFLRTKAPHRYKWAQEWLNKRY